MPGIFDILAANGVLDSLFGNSGQAVAANKPAAAMVDTGDDTQRMKNRVTGSGSVSNPTAPVPLIVQAMENGGVPVNTAGASYLPPDAEQAMAQADINPQTIAPAADPFANTYNASAAMDTAMRVPQQAAGMAEMLGLNFDRPLARLAMGLGAAGSQDPLGTLMKMKANEEEIRNSQSERNKPKFMSVAGLPGVYKIMPDGRVEYVQDPKALASMVESNTIKLGNDLIKINARGQVENANKTTQLTNKDLIEQAGGVDAPVEFRGGVTSQITKIDNLLGAVRGIDTVAGIETPFIANLIDQTYGRVAGTNSYSFRRDLETIVNKDVLALAGEMKGALSDKDVTFLKSIQPRPDDPVDRKLAYLNELKSRLQAGEERRIEAAKSLRERGVTGQSGNTQSGQPTASQPAPKQNNQGSDLSAQASSAFGAYEPDVYEYRVNNGVLQRRKK